MVGLYGHGYTEGGLSLLPLRMTSHPRAGDPSMSVQSWGDGNDLSSKVMLLLGNDPGRKESFKDTLVNYLFEVKVQDTWRLVLVDDYACVHDPRAAKVYVFNQREGGMLPFNLVVVDLPPLGALDGTHGDVTMLLAVERFLEQEFGTPYVDGITVVAPSPDDPLHALRNAYHLLALCFEDLASLTQVVVTDSSSCMVLLAALKEHNVRYRSFFVFDNDNTATTNAAATVGSGLGPEEYFFRQIFCHFDFHGVDDLFQELRDIPPQRMRLRATLKVGDIDVSHLAKLRMVQQYTEVAGVTQHSLSLHQLIFKVEHRNVASRTQHLVLGEANNKPRKVMVLIGDRSAGKTTLLTAVVNHVLGVKYHDRFCLLVAGDPLHRLDKKQQLQQTRFTTAYTLHAAPQPYHTHSLTLIDTPGLRGPEEHTHNRRVATRLAALRHTCDIPHVTVIGLVAAAGTERLPDTYRAVSRIITSLVTTEGGERLLLLATRTDAKRAAVSHELRRLGLPITASLRFNAHSVFADSLDKDEDDATHDLLAKQYWTMEEHSLRCLLAELLL